jgi:hypothetical protein
VTTVIVLPPRSGSGCATAVRGERTQASKPASTMVNLFMGRSGVGKFSDEMTDISQD